jgi:long-chain acyl-CoA synthetase
MKRYPLYETVFYKNFFTLLRDTAEKFGTQPAITCYTDTGVLATHSYAQLCTDVLRAANALCKQGICGRRVALAGENSYEWLGVFLAAIIAGSDVILIDIEQPTGMIKNILQYADADLLFASKPIRELLDGELSMPLHTLSEESFTALCEEQEEDIREKKQRDASVLVFTSGTTADPKAVELSYGRILQNAGEAIAMVQGTPKIYSPLPLYHAYGLTCGVVANLIAGAHICINGDLKIMMRDLVAFRPGTVMAVPLLAEQIYRMLRLAAKRQPDAYGIEEKKRVFRIRKSSPPTPEALRLKRELLGDVQIVVCGGAHLPPEISKGLEAFGILTLQGYGITECSPLYNAVSCPLFCPPKHYCRPH